MLRKTGIAYFSLVLFCMALSPVLADDAAVSSEAAVTNAENAFGFNLLHRLYPNSELQNVFISPTSIHLALSVAYIGAHGATKSAMGKTLQLDAMTDDTLSSGTCAFIADEAKSDQATGGFEIANSLWASKNVVFRPAFIASATKDFNSSEETLDFHSPESVKTINRWVNTQTHGKIPTILDRIEPSDQMFIINAVHFQSGWSRPFRAENTIELPFTTAVGTQHPVKMMRQTDLWSYSETDTYQAIRLGYVGQQSYMLVVLPKGGESLHHLIASLTPAKWAQIGQGLTTQNGEIDLPRIKLECKNSLNAPLSDLGMGIAFSRHADFSAMMSPSCNISQVIHKTFLAVDEQGTEAAAVTSTGMRSMAMRQPVQVPFKMVVDHPFLCAIVDRLSGAIMFIGAITDPSHG